MTHLSRKTAAICVIFVLTSLFRQVHAEFVPQGYNPEVPAEYKYKGPFWDPAPEQTADSNVKPDCRETPVPFNFFQNIAKQKEITNQTEFLRALPKDSFQSFTLMAKSDSPEAPCISEEFPGVLRLSIDGSTVFRYTCDPKCGLYNKIQVLHFDDSQRRWQPAEIDFSQSTAHRVDLKPESCKNCHAPNLNKVDIRPNWQQYDQWSGFFGGKDDNLRMLQTLDDESRVPDFKKFRERVRSGDLKDNPCYTELPWYTGSDPEYKDYPYNNGPIDSIFGKTSHYDLRVNLKFGEILGHRLAQRVARMVEEQPAFERNKYRFLMAGFACGESMTAADEMINELGMPVREESQKYQDLATPHELAANLIKGLGLEYADLTMHFNKPDTFVYSTGIAPASKYASGDSHRDPKIAEVVLGNILKDMSKSDPDLRRFVELGRGESEHFGQRFACIDDLGGALFLNEVGRYNLCNVLTQKNVEQLKKVAPVAVLGGGSQVRTTPSLSAIRIIDGPSARGQKIVENTCAHCHGVANEKKLRAELHFFESPAATLNELCKPNANLIERVKVRTQDEYDPMPPMFTYDQLTQSQTADLVGYLQALKSQCH